jgi:hypothetical protein
MQINLSLSATDHHPLTPLESANQNSPEKCCRVTSDPKNQRKTLEQLQEEKTKAYNDGLKKLHQNNLDPVKAKLSKDNCITILSVGFGVKGKSTEKESSQGRNYKGMLQ